MLTDILAVAIPVVIAIVVIVIIACSCYTVAPTDRVLVITGLTPFLVFVSSTTRTPIRAYLP